METNLLQKIQIKIQGPSGRIQIKKKPQIEKPKRRQPTREEIENNFFDMMDKYETRKMKRRQAREAEEAKKRAQAKQKPRAPVAQKIVKKQPEKSVWDDYF